MADYHTPTVVQQTIPNDDMTPLERLLLTNIFDADDIDGEHYFYAKNALKPCLLSTKRNSTPRSPRPSNTRAQRFLQFRSSSLIASRIKA